MQLQHAKVIFLNEKNVCTCVAERKGPVEKKPATEPLPAKLALQLGTGSSPDSSISSSRHCKCSQKKTAEDDLRTWTPALTWEIWVKLLIPGFYMVQPRPLQPFGILEEKPVDLKISLSSLPHPSHPLSTCTSNK